MKSQLQLKLSKVNIKTKGVSMEATLACYSATLAITVSQQTIIKPAESRMIIMRFRNDAGEVDAEEHLSSLL